MIISARLPMSFFRSCLFKLSLVLLLWPFGGLAQTKNTSATLPTKWAPLPTPPAGSVRSQARTLDGRLFAGTTGGIYRSTDHGESWLLLGLENSVAESLLATKEGTLLAGTYREGLFRSADGGLTWQQVGFGRNIYLYGLAQDADGTVYLSATLAIKDEPQGVFRSRDDGKTWEPAGLADKQVFSLSLPVAGSLYAGTEEGLFVTRDRGLTWTPAGDGIPKRAIVSTVIVSGRTLLAATGMRQDARSMQMPGEGIFQSEDNGGHWTPFNAGLPPHTSVRALVSTGKVVLAAAGPIEGGGSGIYRSENFGPWQQVGLNGIWARGLLRLPSGRVLASADGQAMFRSDDGGTTWSQSATGFANWETVGLLTFGSRILATSHRGTFVSDDGGHHWVSATGPSAMTYLAASHGSIYGGALGGVVTSRDGGSSWRQLPAITKDGVARDVAVHSDGRILAAVAGTDSGLYESADGGQTWTRAPLQQGDKKPGAISVAVTPQGTIIAGASNGIQRSLPAGGFERVNDAGAFGLRACAGGTLWAAAYEKGVLKSTDNGKTWIAMTERQRQESHQKGYLTVTSVLCTRDGSILASTLGNGVLLSDDDGATWSYLNQGLRSLDLWDLTEDSRGNIFASTANGVHQLEGYRGRTPNKPN